MEFFADLSDRALKQISDGKIALPQKCGPRLRSSGMGAKE